MNKKKKKKKRIKGKYIVTKVEDTGPPYSREVVLSSTGEFDLNDREWIIGKVVSIVLS